MSTETEQAIKLTKELIETLRIRGDAYGSNEHRTAQIMLILYPKGLTYPTLHDMIKYKFVIYIVDKLCRYIKGGHKDSLMDLAGYALRLAAFEQEEKDEQDT
jgi:hypothetical protein